MFLLSLRSSLLSSPPHLLLVLVSLVKVDVVDVLLQLLDLLVGNVYTELLLRQCESQPHLTPSCELAGRAEDVRHLGGSILGGEERSNEYGRVSILYRTANSFI